MQKNIKILMLHPLCHDVESFIKYTGLQELSDSFIFVWDEINPDFLIVSEHVNTNQKYRDVFENLFDKPNIKIYYAGEAEYPDFNLYDYAVGFSSELLLGDRYCSLPSPFTFSGDFITTNENKIKSIEEAHNELALKSGFCNFLYSNPNAHPVRDMLYHAISRYKRVDSLGKHLNNVKEAGTGFIGHANECVTKKNKYKFSIASENACFPGYTSEKILTSLEAHTIPIYWGDPQITKHINPECFINCNDYSSIEDIIEVIKKIDTDDGLWCKMISSPWQTKEQIEFSSKLNSDYLLFFKDIFNRSFEEGTRIAHGTRPTIYRQYYFNAKSRSVSLISLLLNKMRKVNKVFLRN